MSIPVFFILLLCVIPPLVFIYKQIGDIIPIIILFLSYVALLGIIFLFTNTDLETERNTRYNQERLQRTANEKPHVIREADGCKVYTFLVGDRYQFFTRCKDGNVSTENNWKECHSEQQGETTVQKCVDKSMSIQTIEEK